MYSSIHINSKKMKTFNVHISAVWTKWPTQGQILAIWFKLHEKKIFLSSQS